MNCSRILLVALIFASALQAQAQAATTLIQHVRVFDGARTVGTRDVLVRDVRVAEIGVALAVPRGAVLVVGANRTLLPGFIDSHTHAYGDFLSEALVYGVTTELDMFTDPLEAKSKRDEQKRGAASSRADLYSAGVLVTAPGGHGTEYGIPIPTIAVPESAQAFVDARIAEGSDYIKIVLDDGSTYGRSIPTVSRATLAAVIKAAHARRKLAVVHVGTLADARAAIDVGADGLMHLFVDRAPDAEFGRFVATHRAFVVALMATGSRGCASACAPSVASSLWIPWRRLARACKSPSRESRDDPGDRGRGSGTRSRCSRRAARDRDRHHGRGARDGRRRGHRAGDGASS